MINKNLIPNPVFKAIKLLNENFYEAFLVGGSVRDLLSQKKPCDFDITTSATPDELKKIFKDYRIICSGIKYGTLTVIIEEMPLEITTYRLESDYSDYRRPEKIRFTKNLKEDLSRRDFTINSIAYHPLEGIIDYFSGIKDLQNKILRTVGEPEQRFQEDALRILRALRFASVMDFRIDEKTSKAIKKQKYLLMNIALERINQEFRKLLVGSAAQRILRQYSFVIAVFIPELKELFNFKSPDSQNDYDTYQYTITVVGKTPPLLDVRLAALYLYVAQPFLTRKDKSSMDDQAKYTLEIAKNSLFNLKFEKKLIDKVSVLICNYHQQLIPDEMLLKKKLAKLGADTFKKLIILQIAAAKAINGPLQKNKIRDLKKTMAVLEKIIIDNPPLQIADLQVDGSDVMSFGLKGQQVGQALESLLEDVLENKIKNQREFLLVALEKLSTEIFSNEKYN